MIYLTLCLVSHQYTTPAIEECGTFKLGWIATVFTRNLVLLWLVSGGWHLALYQLKTEGTKKKYDHKWQATNNPRFLFNDQVYDNVFWSCTSGVGFWTAYEVIMLNWWSTNPQASAVYFDFWSRPVYSIAWLLAIPIWREFHFYWVHRFSHVKIVYVCHEWVRTMNRNIYIYIYILKTVLCACACACVHTIGCVRVRLRVRVRVPVGEEIQFTLENKEWAVTSVSSDLVSVSFLFFFISFALICFSYPVINYDSSL